MFRTGPTLALILFLACRIATAQPNGAPEAPPAPPRVLILPFTMLADQDRHAWIGRAIQQNLQAEIGRTGAFEVLGRIAIAPQEAPPPALVAIDEETALQLGHNANADLVIFGSYQVVEPDVRITGKVMEVASGRTLGFIKANGTLRELLSIEDALVEQTMEVLGLRPGVPGQAAEPEWAEPPRAPATTATAPALDEYPPPDYEPPIYIEQPTYYEPYVPIYEPAYIYNPPLYSYPYSYSYYPYTYPLFGYSYLNFHFFRDKHHHHGHHDHRGHFDFRHADHRHDVRSFSRAHDDRRAPEPPHRGPRFREGDRDRDSGRASDLRVADGRDGLRIASPRIASVPDPVQRRVEPDRARIEPPRRDVSALGSRDVSSSLRGSFRSGALEPDRTAAVSPRTAGVSSDRFRTTELSSDRFRTPELSARGARSSDPTPARTADSSSKANRAAEATPRVVQRVEPPSRADRSAEPAPRPVRAMEIPSRAARSDAPAGRSAALQPAPSRSAADRREPASSIRSRESLSRPAPARVSLPEPRRNASPALSGSRDSRSPSADRFRGSSASGRSSASIPSRSSASDRGNSLSRGSASPSRSSAAPSRGSSSSSGSGDSGGGRGRR